MTDVVKEQALSLSYFKNLKDKRSKIERLYQCTPKLKDIELVAIYCRYWENMTIEEISKVIQLSWDSTDALIEGALLQLRTHMAQENKL
jgi:DNA-directed RNA polymerase specialized sigma24 family protein